MREWLTVIIILLIAGILLDGLRRVRRARRENLRISRKARQLNPEDFPESGSEICSEPRVVRHRDKRDAETITKSMRESFAKSRVTVGAPPRRIPEQVALNLQESVPMLMDSVEEFRPADVPRRERDYTQPPSWAEPELDDDHKYGDDYTEANDTWVDDEPELGSMDAIADEGDAYYAEPEYAELEQNVAPEQVAPRRSNSASKAAETSDTRREREEPSEVLIINLMAPAGQHFDGSELLNTLLDHGLRYGAMNIFHRHKHADGSGPVQFSLANMVVPGTFDLSAMDDFSTPGVSMFLSLPNDDESLAAFDCMAETARAMAKTLGGELKDENRSVMTRQTLEHCRQRVIEFERKQRLMQYC